jgi:hypothetical protein
MRLYETFDRLKLDFICQHPFGFRIGFIEVLENIWSLRFIYHNSNFFYSNLLLLRCLIYNFYVFGKTVSRNNSNITCCYLIKGSKVNRPRLRFQMNFKFFFCANCIYDLYVFDETISNIACSYESTDQLAKSKISKGSSVGTR